MRQLGVFEIMYNGRGKEYRNLFHIFACVSCLLMFGRRFFGPSNHHRSKADEGRLALAETVLCHVPVVAFNFQAKALFVATIMRRMFIAMKDSSQIDDKDYYGNKRLELYAPVSL